MHLHFPYFEVIFAIELVDLKTSTFSFCHVVTNKISNSKLKNSFSLYYQMPLSYRVITIWKRKTKNCRFTKGKKCLALLDSEYPRLKQNPLLGTPWHRKTHAWNKIHARQEIGTINSFVPAPIGLSGVLVWLFLTSPCQLVWLFLAKPHQRFFKLKIGVVVPAKTVPTKKASFSIALSHVPAPQLETCRLWALHASVALL